MIFDKTCEACPEQYDVRDEKSNMLAYIRLRWGRITIECSDVGGIVIFNEAYGDELCGGFMCSKDRCGFLNKAEKLINEYYQSIGGINNAESK